MDSRGFFFVAKMPQDCTEVTRIHGDLTERPDGEASGTGAEQERGKPMTLFMAIRKSKKWCIKVVT